MYFWVILQTTHTPHLSCHPSTPNLFQRVAATGPNVSHLTRLAANLACQYVSSLIHQLSLFISAVLLPSHFTAERLDFAPSSHSSIPPPGRPLQGVKAMTVAVLAKPKCGEGKQKRGGGWTLCSQLIVNLSAQFCYMQRLMIGIIFSSLIDWLWQAWESHTCMRYLSSECRRTDIP